MAWVMRSAYDKLPQAFLLDEFFLAAAEDGICGLDGSAAEAAGAGAGGCGPHGGSFCGRGHVLLLARNDGSNSLASMSMFIELKPFFFILHRRSRKIVKDTS